MGSIRAAHDSNGCSHAGDDLARVAESFVGLQVLRQLTQAEMETVGGPIDVAVITRADGFRWVSGKSLPA